MALIEEYKACVSMTNVDSSEKYIQELSEKYGLK
jgi:hypothetical protein